MTFKHIISRDNPIFKQLKKLAEQARERKQTNKTLLDGVHLIESYLQICGELELLIIPEGQSSTEASARMQTLADVQTIMLPTLMFTELSPVVNGTGILAMVNIPHISPPQQINCALMIEDIQDPGNLGSILRTAVAAGVDAAYLSTGCTDAWSPKALRGGQGAQMLLPIVERVNLIEAIQQFSGQSLASAMQGESLYQQDFKQPTAFVIGNEGAGLRESTIQACHKKITIPMVQHSRGKIESLNVGAATAIMLFEHMRQTTNVH